MTQIPVLLSYDVEQYHGAVMTKLTSPVFGYSDKYSGYTLPNTTVYHSNKTSQQAIDDLKTVCKSVGTSILKAVAVEAYNFKNI